MYRCESCGEVFEKAKEVNEPLEYFGQKVNMTEHLCPHCGSDDLAEVHECECCHVNLTEDNVCKECVDDMRNMISQMLADFEDEHDCDYSFATNLLIDTLNE